VNDHANGHAPVVPNPLRHSFALCLLAAAGWLVQAVADDGPRPESPSAAATPAAVPSDWQGTPAEKDVAWLIGDVLAGRSADYRAAVEEVLQRQARFCDGDDRLNRVTIHRASKDDGTIALSLHSRPGRSGHGDSSASMTLRDGAVIRLGFFAESAFDDCPCMETLDPDYVDDGFLEVVARIDTLEEIDDLPAFRITAAGIRSIARLSDLKSLDVYGVTLSSDDLEPLGALQRLEKLSYSHGKEKAGEPARLCALLARHSMLREVDLSCIDLTCEAAAALASCSRLKTLEIGASHLESGALDAFAAHDQLESLSLDCLAATEPIVLRGGPALRALDLSAVGPEVEIVVTSLPALRSLSLRASRPAPQDPAVNDESERVTETGHPPRISVDGLAALENLSITLSDRHADVATETGEVRLAGLPSLERIRLKGTVPRDVTLRDMPRLSEVSIWDAGPLETVTLIDCPALKRCGIGGAPKLTKLDLREARAKADVQTSLSTIIDKRAILRPDPTAESGAATTP
jgi:hypothetical protein